jgi:hypothetical protein
MSKTRLLKFKCVESVDDYGMPEGEWFVYLKEGYAFSDASEDPEDDPEAKYAEHTSGGDYESLAEKLRNVSPCKCGRCVGWVNN